MSELCEIRLSGSGGQGLILAGIILAEAAIAEGKMAIQTQSYGPEARGGASKAEVIVSDGEIDYPKVGNADIFVAMNQKACDKYIGQLKDGAIAIFDTTYVKEIPTCGAKIYRMPISQLAIKEAGKEMVANIVVLGALTGITQIVDKEAMKKAVLARIPRGTEDLNMKAFEVGYMFSKNNAMI